MKRLLQELLLYIVFVKDTSVGGFDIEQDTTIVVKRGVTLGPRNISERTYFAEQSDDGRAKDDAGWMAIMLDDNTKNE